MRPGHAWQGPVKHAASGVNVGARVLVLLRAGLNEGECPGVQPVCAVETFVMMPMFDLED